MMQGKEDLGTLWWQLTHGTMILDILNDEGGLLSDHYLSRCHKGPPQLKPRLLTEQTARSPCATRCSQYSKVN